MKTTENRYTLCPQCGASSTSCVDSRIHHATGGRRRRYNCTPCGYRWSTLELPYDLLESLHKVQPAVDTLTHDLVILRDLLHRLPLDKLGVLQMYEAEVTRLRNNKELI